MIDGANLRRLADMSAADRVFLSVYLSGPSSMEGFEHRCQEVERALRKSEAGKDEREHFLENLDQLKKYLKKNPLKSGSLCAFSCFALDFFEAHPLTVPVKDLVWVDSSPYVRPLAEIADDYETVAVVVADNRRTRIFLVSANTPGPEETFTGNVKNHVRKGGWSQQRYERRRDKQLLHYGKEISAALSRLAQTESFRRIILTGSKETLRSIKENLPDQLLSKVSSKALDLGRGEGALNQDIMELIAERERDSEQSLFEHIRTAYLRGSLAVAGLESVMKMAESGRIETMIVDRDYHPEGRRCRECEQLHFQVVNACEKCGGSSLFTVDAVNEICEILYKTSSKVDFTDPLPELTNMGRVAALLRY